MYGDMTGYGVQNFTVFDGWYRIAFTSALPAPMRWTTLWVEVQAPEGASVQVRVRSAEPGAALQLAPWSVTLGPLPPETSPLDLATLALAGRGLEVELMLHSESAKVSPVVTSVKAAAQAAP
jgi:hypothetical protein